MKNKFKLLLFVLLIASYYNAQGISVTLINRNIIQKSDRFLFEKEFLHNNKSNKIKALTIYNHSKNYVATLKSYKKKKRLWVTDTIIDCKLINRLSNQYSESNTSFIYNNSWPDKMRYDRSFDFFEIKIPSNATVREIVSLLKNELSKVGPNSNHILIYLASDEMKSELKVNNSLPGLVVIDKSPEEIYLENQLKLSGKSPELFNIVFPNSFYAEITPKEPAKTDNTSITMNYTDRYNCVQEISTEIKYPIVQVIPVKIVDSLCLNKQVDIVFPDCKDPEFRNQIIYDDPNQCKYHFVKDPSGDFYQVHSASVPEYMILLNTCADEVFVRIHAKTESNNDFIDITESVTHNTSIKLEISKSRDYKAMQIYIPEELLTKYDKFKIQVENSSNDIKFPKSMSNKKTVVFSSCND